MKKILLPLLLFAVVLPSLRAADSKPFTIPEVKEWKAGSGNFSGFSGRICVPESLAPIAEQLVKDLAVNGSKEMKIVTGTAKKGDIVLTTSDSKRLGDEGYTIEISDKVIISAPTNLGIFWGTRTLLQLREQGPLPCGTIMDQPEYGLRGFMIDCGRKYIPMDYLRNLVKIMAYYKMNTLQVHLNDNGFKRLMGNDWNTTYGAFRLESETFPGLAASDGFYTKDEFRQFQKDAAALGVTIIPEIDAPAHTLAFSHYKPTLGSQEYGMDHLDLFNPETYEFMDALWKEYLEGDDPVFVGKRVHIGTDEYSNKDQEVVEKFRYFTDRYIRYVESFGKQACAWGALTHADGKTPVKSENVILSEWYNGYADPVKMREDGYEMISIPDGWTYIVPAVGYYYDYLDLKMLYDKWTPAHIGEATFEENDPQILGGMFAEWNDHCGNGISISDIHDRVYPGIQTLSAKCWSGSRTIVPFETFDAGRKSLSEAPGVNELGTIPQTLKFAKYRHRVKYYQQFVGYGNKVTFTIKARKEKLGTELSSCNRSTFWLSDPKEGKLGFSRDGYDYTFDYTLEPGEKHTITVEMTNEHTRLYVDGELKDDLGIQIYYVDPEGKNRMEKVQTLVFPLGKAGSFKSRIRHLVVEKIQ